MKDSKRIIVVGAGITGLTLAYTLSRDGYDVTLVEKESSVGGLARSFTYDGYTFDIGPHRFHTDLPEINSFIFEVLGNDYRTIERKSGVWMNGTFFDWPLDIRSLLRMPASLLLPAGLDLFRRKSIAEGSACNFEDYIISNYGKTLYQVFFKDFTEKFLHLPCTQISRDWAITGIDRAVIDNEIKLNDLGAIARSFFKRKPPLRFIYPGSGGTQVFCDNLRDGILRHGGRILLNSHICRLKEDGDVVTAVRIGEDEYPADLVVWTGTVNSLLSLLEEPASGLEYLCMVLYNYRLDRVPLQDYQWCYYGAAGIPFNRVSIPTLFNPVLAPSGKGGVCVEVTCRKGDPAWESPFAADSAIRDALVSVGVIGALEDISGVAIEKVQNVYPVYSVEYRSKLQTVLEVTGRRKNLKLLGRTGAFWYNNMDQSIEAALGFYREYANRSTAGEQ